jgi:hypothetical protein
MGLTRLPCSGPTSLWLAAFVEELSRLLEVAVVGELFGLCEEGKRRKMVQVGVGGSEHALDNTARMVLNSQGFAATLVFPVAGDGHLTGLARLVLLFLSREAGARVSNID